MAQGRWTGAPPRLADALVSRRTHAVVVEMTPRIRNDAHPGWTVAKLQALADHQVPVRVNGWLMFDQEPSIGRSCAAHIPLNAEPLRASLAAPDKRCNLPRAAPLRGSA